jgi:hypothetical protein
MTTTTTQPKPEDLRIAIAQEVTRLTGRRAAVVLLLDGTQSVMFADDTEEEDFEETVLWTT